ncbi:MAG: asparagine synthase (glutamine-hydrolyzing) [Nitrospirae bacterium]|nr:asparagine synthase (glutamine-hydrolyzing) [Nitrospirota bacterium]
MCGIFGIVNKDSKAPSEEFLRDVTRSIAHRGPDGEGYYTSRNVALAHRRLSIIDPEGGKQPMCNEDETVWITFNGCIYNYLELRQQLLQRGHRFRTHCDTEVIIHAYEEFGKDCVNYFNGMWAFAIWDSRQQELFCSRDRLGVKPFYYSCDGNSFLFSSEIKALVKAGVKPEVSPEGLNDYITFQFTIGDKTLFKGIKRLLPGCSLTLRMEDFRLSVEKYWDLRYEYDTYHNEEYFIDRLFFLLEDAVKIRLRSDVPLGAHLSGGIDSSTIACLAASLLGSFKLKTFTGGFSDGKEFDETEYAKIVSRAAGTDFHEIFPTARDFIADFPRLVYFMDEPAAGPGIFPQYQVCKLAREHVKVVLGGQGGDEIFIGYARYLVGYLEEALKGAIWETAKEGKFAVTLESIVPNLPILQAYKPMLSYFWKDGLFGPQDERYFRLIDRSEGMKEMFSPDAMKADTTLGEFRGLFNEKNLSSLVNKMTYFDTKASLPALLQVEDRTSMAFGLESRVPLLDYRIIEFVASIPPVIKFKGGDYKHLLKNAAKSIVPREIIERKDKMGFPVPLNKWYQNELKEFVSDIIMSPAAAQRGIYNTSLLKNLMETEGKFSRIVWGILCLEQWFRGYIDGEYNL